MLTSERAEKVGQKGKLQNANPGGKLVEHNSGRQRLMVRDLHNEDRWADANHPSSQNQMAACFSLSCSILFSLCFRDTHFFNVYFLNLCVNYRRVAVLYLPILLEGKFSTCLYSLGVNVSNLFVNLYSGPLMVALLQQVSFISAPS